MPPAITTGDRGEPGERAGPAARDVLIQQGLVYADWIAEAEATLAGWRGKLAGIDRLWLSGGPVKLPQRLARTLGGVSGGAGAWQGYHGALLRDPEYFIE